MSTDIQKFQKLYDDNNGALMVRVAVVTDTQIVIFKQKDFEVLGGFNHDTETDEFAYYVANDERAHGAKIFSSKQEDQRFTLKLEANDETFHILDFEPALLDNEIEAVRRWKDELEKPDTKAYVDSILRIRNA